MDEGGDRYCVLQIAAQHVDDWPAGREMAQAIALLSDGAFRLFAYLCLHANRQTGRLVVNNHDLAAALHRSRRSIIKYLDELERQGVCRIDLALNQYRGGKIEICDAFWPYRHNATALTRDPPRPDQGKSTSRPGGSALSGRTPTKTQLAQHLPKQKPP